MGQGSWKNLNRLQPKQPTDPRERKQIISADILEHRQAARYNGYTWEQWLELAGDPDNADGHDSKATCIAFYRIEGKLEQLRG